MNTTLCKRCMHTGERTPGRVTNLSNDRLTGNTWALCEDHADWAYGRLTDARKAGGDVAERGMWAAMYALYARADGAITRRTTPADRRKNPVPTFA